MLWCSKSFKLYNNFENTTVIQRQNSAILSPLNVNLDVWRWNNAEFELTLKAVLFLYYNAWERIYCVLKLKWQPYFNFETTSFCRCQIIVET